MVVVITLSYLKITHHKSFNYLKVQLGSKDQEPPSSSPPTYVHMYVCLDSG